MIVFGTGFDAWWVIGFALVAAVIGATLIRNWIKADLLPDGSGPIQYQESVSAWKRSPQTGGFVMLKGGTGPLTLTVRDDTISLRHPSFPRHFAATFGLDYTLMTHEVTVNPDDETVSYGRSTVVLYGTEQDGPIQLAIRPADHDLARLRTALALAGTRTPQNDP